MRVLQLNHSLNNRQWSVWHYVSHGGWMELPFLLLLWRPSDPMITELHKVPRSFSIKLHSKTQVSGRLGMFRGRSPRHAQNSLLGERRITLSITHHALSPPPSHHHLCIIHVINWLQRFYGITMSLKRPSIFAEKWRKTRIYYYYYMKVTMNNK